MHAMPIAFDKWKVTVEYKTHYGIVQRRCCIVFSIARDIRNFRNVTLSLCVMH